MALQKDIELNSGFVLSYHDIVDFRFIHEQGADGVTSVKLRPYKDKATHDADKTKHGDLIQEIIEGVPPFSGNYKTWCEDQLVANEKSKFYQATKI